jgi:hypothetical protein
MGRAAINRGSIDLATAAQDDSTDRMMAVGVS